jgi:hypothetical protein
MTSFNGTPSYLHSHESISPTKPTLSQLLHNLIENSGNGYCKILAQTTTATKVRNHKWKQHDILALLVS